MRTIKPAYASAARTASPTDAVVSVPPRANRLVLVIDVTSVTLTPSVVFNVRGLGPSGTSYLLLASAAVATVSVVTLHVGPGFPVTANLSAHAVLPETVVIDPVHGDADSITYRVDAVFV